MKVATDIIDQSLANFEARTGFALVVISRDCLVLTADGERYEFAYYVVKSITVPEVADTYDTDEAPRILVAQYISSPAKELLREQNVNYLDAAGNAYLKLAGRLLVHIETGKSARPTSKIRGRAFTPAGLRVVYQFLTQDTINLSYREIGQRAGVSIDTVSKTVKDLLASSYLIEIKSKAYELNQHEELVEAWVTSFNQTLRPRLKSAYFSYRPGAGPHDLVKNSPYGSLSGELAADVLGTNLIGEQATLYTDQPLHALARTLNLMPAGKEGPVEIVRQFWNHPVSDRRTVSPLLVYADLRYGATPRDLVAAGQLYESHVRPSL